MTVRANGTYSNVTFYPMIRLASIEDDTYEPCYKGLADITKITERVIYSGSKNLLKNTAVSQTISGVTFTVNEDGSVTANGTATANIYLYIPLDRLDTNIQYVLSGCPAGGSNTTSYKIIVQGLDDKNALHVLGMSFGTDSLFTLDVPLHSMQVAIVVHGEYVANNLTFYPMIRLASIEDDTYEPYYVGLMEVPRKLLSMELLWENDDMDSNFLAQTLNNIDYSCYDRLKIDWALSKSNTTILSEDFPVSAGSTMLFFVNYVNGKYTRNMRKAILSADKKSIEFTIDTEDAEEGNGIYIVPKCIFGIKGVS